MDVNNLTRFITAQQNDYQTALGEIKQGRKRSHWMWYIFPQVKGLGFSETSRYYGIKGLKEAEDYLNHPVLGDRLILISQELIKLNTDNATVVFGTPDDMKLRSSMTLFASISGTNPVFQQVLDKYYGGKMDEKTLRILDR